MVKLANFTSGTKAKSTEVEGNDVFSLIAAMQNRIDTLRSVTERTPESTKAFTLRDVFTDSDGKNDSIDTGNTTATFITDAYIADLTGESSGGSTSGYTANNDFTVTMTAISDGYISGFTFGYGAGSNNIDYYLTIKNQAGTTICSKSWLSVDGDGSRIVSLSASDYTAFLTAGETFTIRLNSSGIDTLYKSNTNKSYSGTHFSYSSQSIAITSRNGSTTTSYTYQAFTDAVVETDVLTSSGDNINSFLVGIQSEEDDTTPITISASSDNKSTWTTGLSPDEINELTSTLGNQFALRFHIPGNASSKLYGYSVVMGRVS